MNAQMQDKIVESLRYFDSFQLAEVLNFVQYLKTKNSERKKNLKHIDLMLGKYRDKLSSSDEFAKLKKVEKEKEENKWKTN